MLQRFSRPVRHLGSAFVLLIAGVVLLVIISLSGRFIYILHAVEAQEIGVQFRQGRIYRIVDPGVYSDVGVYVTLQTLSTQAVAFEVRDEELITKDKQRIGLIVSGDIFRPTDKDTIRNNWAQYRGLFLEDETAVRRVSDLTRQSMKVCVGDRTFDNNIIGTSRDELRACIDTELNKLAGEFGLHIDNVVVPEVILSAEVQAALDAIVQSRLETEKAAQDELKAKAEASAEQARQEGQIRIEQSRIQEQARQQTQLAVLEQQRLAAQLQVIEAERANALARLETERQTIQSGKSNELHAAERDVAIQAQMAAAAREKAKADAALEAALAAIYVDNPLYVDWLMAQANASALRQTDKVIFTSEGMTPSLVLPGPGIVPVVDASAQSDPAQP